MAFKKVATLDTDTTVTLGGHDKKTGKANPEVIEGYFLGTKCLGPNKFNKTKTDYMHILQTQDGNVGVWGKVHMDRQIHQVNPGTMVRITYTGTLDVGKGNPMSCFSVEVDEDNTIEVNLAPAAASPAEDADYDDGEEDGYDEGAAADEVAPTRATAPRRAAAAPSAAQQAKVKSLLGGGKNKLA
jgi:hypothetical protein